MIVDVVEEMLGEWWISVDKAITRRKRFHIVVNPLGDRAFSSRLLWECLEWLEAEGIESYSLKPAEVPYASVLASVKITKDRKTWQK